MGAPGPQPSVEEINTSALETLLGYNARRASLAVIDRFLDRMSRYELRPVEFSVLCLIVDNPGITSRQLCTALGILPPNLVGLVGDLERRELVARQPHPRDGRAFGLHPTAGGRKLMAAALRTATQLELEVGHRLTTSEHRTLRALLQKVYKAD